MGEEEHEEICQRCGKVFLTSEYALLANYTIHGATLCNLCREKIDGS